MQFSSFKNLLPKLQKNELPGLQAQVKMAPFERQDQLLKLDYSKLNAKNSAVLALLYPNKSEVMQLVFIQRKTYKGVHSNQIGFPGGKVEKKDLNLLDTALRETEEEIGITKSKIKLITGLTKLYIPPSNFIVYPFLSYLDHQPEFILQETEVDRVYSIPLETCLDHKNEVIATVSAAYAKNVSVNAFKFDQRIVWGATAMMLSEIKHLILNTIKA